MKFARDIKDFRPDIWRKGGNIYGNRAFSYAQRLYKGDFSPSVLKWLKKREAWAARHFRDFRLPGVVAQIKWLVIGRLGEKRMKKLVIDHAQSSRR